MYVRMYMFFKTKGVTVNKRPANSGMRRCSQINHKKQRKERAKTIAKLVAALCKNGAECSRTLRLLEGSLDAAACLCFSYSRPREGRGVWVRTYQTITDSAESTNYHSPITRKYNLKYTRNKKTNFITLNKTFTYIIRHKFLIKNMLLSINSWLNFVSVMEIIFSDLRPCFMNLYRYYIGLGPKTSKARALRCRMVMTARNSTPSLFICAETHSSLCTTTIPANSFNQTSSPHTPPCLPTSKSNVRTDWSPPFSPLPPSRAFWSLMWLYWVSSKKQWHMFVCSGYYKWCLITSIIVISLFKF